MMKKSIENHFECVQNKDAIFIHLLQIKNT